MKIHKNKICVVMALEEEGSGLIEPLLETPILYTGVGKVNSAMKLSKHLAENKYELVINLGSAGSTAYPVGTLVVGTSYTQRDMDAVGFGYEMGQTPGEPAGTMLENFSINWDDFTGELKIGTIHTADRFEMNAPKGMDAIDMESYALAKTAKLFNTPFISIKWISDGANEDANDTWTAGVEKNSGKALQQALNYIINKVS